MATNFSDVGLFANATVEERAGRDSVTDGFAGIIACRRGSPADVGRHRDQQTAGSCWWHSLIGHTLRHFVEIGVSRVAIIFNGRESDCAEWVQANFPSLELEILVKSTRSSFESFWRVGRALGWGGT
jgi:hypothetical protein